MKVKDFIPFYGYVYDSNTLFYIGQEPLKNIHVDNILHSINRKEFIYIKTLFEDEKFQNLELNEHQVYELITDDHLLFTSEINRLPVEEVIPTIRNCYDDYVDNGGDPLEWLRYMIDDVSNLILNYNVNIRHQLQVIIMEWYEIALKYEKYYLDNKDLYQINKRDNNDIKRFEDIFIPKYHNSIETFLEIIRKTNPPILDHSNKCIDRTGNIGCLGMFLRALKQHGVIKVNLSSRHSSQVSKLFGFHTSTLFSKATNQLYLDLEDKINREIRSIITSI